MTTTLTYTITINADRQNVRDTMLNHPTYEQWTTAFAPNSTYVGDREVDSEIRFVDEENNGGMIARIAEAIPTEYISIEHHTMFECDSESGEVVETVFSEPYSYENYRFTSVEGATTVEVEITNFPDEYAEMFDAMRPEALQLLKSLCE